uniref:Uncharacterized protein n=1 Tax=Triticum urartu TaxID=4572 RepID=A0A8R7PXP5_TRIUA
AAAAAVACRPGGGRRLLQQCDVGAEVVHGGGGAGAEVVERELHADVGVAGRAPRPEHPRRGLVQEDARELGDRVVDVGHAERLHAQLVAPRLERRVAHPRPAEGEDGHGRRAVQAQLRQVVGEEQRQGAAHAVAGEGHAHLLARLLGGGGVRVHEAGHLAQELLPAAAGAAEAARLVGGGVEAQEAGLHHDVRARVAGVQPRRLQGAHEVGHPLGGGDGAAERDQHVPPPEPPGHLVRGHRHVADPPAAPAGGGLHGGHGHHVRRRVDVLGHLVPGAGHAHLLQHPLLAVLAVEVPSRGPVEVECLVAGVHQLAVARHLAPERRRRAIKPEQPLPVV